MGSKQVKVLYFVDRMLRGGIQTLVIDWVSRFDKTKIHVDFLLLDDGNKYELEETLKELGCKVYKLNNIWIRNPKDYLKEAKALDNFFKEHHDYKVIHLHSSSKNYLVLKYAKKYGIPTRIAHSHNIGFQTKSSIKIIAGNILKNRLKKYATDFYACSKMAGEWLFGKKIANSDNFEIIHNAVDYNKFQFNKKHREEIRTKYDIKDNEILIGHVGRFTNQKNHIFLIDVFYRLYINNNKYKLIMIGTGELEEKIKEKVNELGINNNVIFAGFQSNVYMYMNAMDYFVFPSLYEGLGLVLIESQANGLKCFATKDKIPDEVRIASNFEFLPLKLEKWYIAIKDSKITRENNEQAIKEKGYFIQDTVRKLENKYLENGE